MKMVTDMSLLRAMKKNKMIKFAPKTGTKVFTPSGRKITAVYIDDDCKEFEFNKKTYRIAYMNGCFFPFVFEM